MIPAGKRQTVLDALDDLDVEYALTDEVSHKEYTAIVSFPLPTEAVEPVLERLREAGIERESYTVILDAETVVSRKFEHLREEYEDETVAERISREELQTRAEEMAPDLSAYLLLTVISVVIATAGVLLDSAAVVVGSMVIAPLIGPAMSTSVGTVLDEGDLFRRGARLQLLGIGVGILAAAVFTATLKGAHLIPPMDVTTIGQVQERLRPDVLSLVVALGAGIAGATSLRTGVSESLVGVMIAVALVPPMAVIGIGIAYWQPFMVLGSTVLVLVNVLSINLAATATLWYAGYRPDNWFRSGEARSATIKRASILVTAILVLSVFLGGVTYMTYTTAVIEDQMTAEIEDTLTEYPGASLVGVEFVHTQDLFQRISDPDPERVVVTVAKPSDQQYPGLSERLRERIDGERGTVVEVRFVDYETAGDETTTNATAGREVRRGGLDRFASVAGPTATVSSTPRTGV